MHFVVLSFCPALLQTQSIHLPWGCGGWSTPDLSVQRLSGILASMVSQARIAPSWPYFHVSETWTSQIQEQPLKNGSLRQVRLLLKHAFPSRMPSECCHGDN